MDEVLNGKLENLAELSADELSTLQDELKTRFTELNSQEDRTRETVESMLAVAEATKQVRSEFSRREEEAKELESLAQQASDIVNKDDDSVEGDPEVEEVVEEAEADQEDEDEKDLEDFSNESAVEDKVVEAEFSNESTEPTESEEDLSQDDEPVSSDEELGQEDELPTENAESVEEEAELNVDTNTESDEDVANTVNTEFSAPNENAPSAESATEVKVPAIVAAADIRGRTAGEELPNMLSLASAILDRRQAMGRTSGGDGEQALVASIRTDHFYGDDRVLTSSDTEGNREKVEAVVASLQNQTREEALVAAGGLYGPVDTSWDIYELGETLGRPVKDSLPSFKADRGGLRFMTPPVLADLEGAVSVWTLQDDIDAATDSGKEKPCIRIKAGEEVTVYIEAMPLCLTFGNIGARAYPELVERHIALAMVWQARFAEARLLTRIGALSKQVTAEAELGAARDILVQVDQAASAMRNRHRLDPEAPLRAIFPVWFKNALRSDLVKQLPGDGQDVAFGLAEATINRWFADRNVSVTWALDGEDGQYFADQTDGALVDFPSTVVWYLFPEGTFLFLEDATLDLGIVRDSTLNATNDYKMFLETFENVAKVGVESLRITTNLAIAGASAGTVNTLA